MTFIPSPAYRAVFHFIKLNSSISAICINGISKEGKPQRDNLQPYTYTGGIPSLVN